MKERILIFGKMTAILTAAILAASAVSGGCGSLPETEPVSAPESLSAVPSDDETQEETIEVLEQLVLDQRALEQAAYDFYDTVYDQFVRMEDLDLSGVMALADPDSYYAVNEIEKRFETRKEAVEAGSALPYEKLPYQITILSYACNNGWGEVYLDLMPLAERTEAVYQDYLDRYPSFMPFGPNALYFRKMSGEWKVYSTTAPRLATIGIGDDLLALTAIRMLYHKAWDNYIRLDYSDFPEQYDYFIYGEGWNKETEKSGFRVALMRDALKADIERWQKVHQTDPEKSAPERLPYELHILRSPMKSGILKNDDRYEIVCARIIPTADREEGMTDVEYLNQYPSFMSFEERYYLFKKDTVNGYTIRILTDIKSEADQLTPAD